MDSVFNARSKLFGISRDVSIVPLQLSMSLLQLRCLLCNYRCLLWTMKSETFVVFIYVPTFNFASKFIVFESMSIFLSAKVKVETLCSIGFWEQFHLRLYWHENLIDMITYLKCIRRYINSKEHLFYTINILTYLLCQYT